jgi:hypothetical protein
MPERCTVDAGPRPAVKPMLVACVSGRTRRGAAGRSLAPRAYRDGS